MALPFTFKGILRQKKKYGKFKYFTNQNYNLQKKSSKRETKNPSRYHNSITNLKVQHQGKISPFKNPHRIKIDLLLLPSRDQNPLSYYILYHESKHNNILQRFQ
jgi:hypothetical protein